jgi:hypothetical protein
MRSRPHTPAGGIIAWLASLFAPNKLTCGYIQPNRKRRHRRRVRIAHNPAGNKMAMRASPESARGCDGTMRR